MATVSLRGNGRFKSGTEAVNAFVAHLPGVKRVVHAEGRSIQGEAEALFASHDRPGGHKITGEKSPIGGTDWIVSLEGPVPVVIEFGREGFTRSDGRRIGPMQGLHILGKAAGL